MRITRLLLHLSLSAVFLAACASTATSVPSAEPASATPGGAEPTRASIVEVTATPVEATDLNTAPATPTVQAVATSRGPNLEATDPKTVSMASGGLQFVEFFEFW
jgi:PBP1b-binding outer membrane lipoprotein LpoB